MYRFTSLLFVLLASIFAAGQNAPAASAADIPADPAFIFEHSQRSRFWVSGQINVIFQAHPPFPAKYSGPNSFKATGEHATSSLLTLYTGAQLTRTTSILFDVESAGGRGLSDALGLAGFTNLDVVRNPQLGVAPYISRILVDQVVPLSNASVESDRNYLSLATQLPARRLELRAGKFTLPDFFDLNSAASDSHLQFMNWTVDNNGAYDYAADTRGYTFGVVAEYQDRHWGARFAEALMPKVANGINLDWNLRRAHSENYEIEFRPTFFKNRASAIRVLSFVNHGNMGSYREAVQSFLSGEGKVPNIEAHRRQGRVKYGFGVNAEQELGKGITAFGRWGWNEGQNESFVYTEVNETVEVGAGVRGDRWGRNFDRAGLAFVSNGISKVHQKYLALGGLGFLLGDGRLTYGRENILESYYTLHLWRGISTGPDLQYIVNPGYNRDRGPVIVPGLRLHVDF